jgi:hypothetical protein
LITEFLEQRDDGSPVVRRVNRIAGALAEIVEEAPEVAVDLLDLLQESRIDSQRHCCRRQSHGLLLCCQRDQ